MFHRILCLLSIGVTLLAVSGITETAQAQVVYGGRTYVRVPNGARFYGTQPRPLNGVYIGYQYGYNPYYSPYVQRRYYPPYGTHYAPYPSYYYAPYGVRYGNRRNYRYR